MKKNFKKNHRIVSLLIAVLICFSLSLQTPKEGTCVSEEEALVDKVFTFHAPHEELIRALPFHQNQTYYIRLEVVTPHACNITMRLNDTRGNVFNIFKAMLDGESAIGFEKEVPFTAASNGTHHVFIDVECPLNMNIYVSIYRGSSPLNFKEDLAWNVTTIIKDNFQGEFNLTFKTDYMYEFYFLRVSTFHENISVSINISFWVRAPDEESTEFLLMEEETVLGVNEKISTFFGTAINGSHACRYELKSNELPFNFAWEVMEKEQISNVIPGNETITPADNSSDDEDSSGGEESQGGGGNGTDGTESNSTVQDPFSNTTSYLPPMFMIPLLTVVGGASATGVIAVLLKKKKMIEFTQEPLLP